jgi:hypothetical protein
MLEGNLHTRILQTKLTPNLAELTGIMNEEIDKALADMHIDSTGEHSNDFMSI